ncbi:GGDEF domain-containing protein [Eubacterium barkeri]|uniref:Diguanylate cyclase (GGDEF) domain-containing protein n=1 Tax=Eubacterium barkeri TaxID=1528 RepID=A0A1H3FQ77_EUBBA|nr:GGDEF domain-containing protein [Eubacterium barkeri]SDX93101.1 diguanylate cyclase (GGDEF) domain-containing protein [Eubacterium barkeri]
MPQLLYSEINLFCMILLVIVLQQMKRVFTEDLVWSVFIKTVVVGIATMALDLLWGLMDSGYIQVAYQTSAIIKGLYFSAAGLMALLWFLFSESTQQSAWVNEPEKKWLCAIPWFIFVILSLLSVQTGWLFYIDETGHYQKGKLLLLQLMLSYGYIIVTSIRAVWKSLQKQKYALRARYRALASFVIFPLLGGLAQIFSPNIPLLCMGITLALLQVFLDFQGQLVSTDSLTKLNNRSQLFEHLARKIRSYDQELYLFIMDIDRFKSINDRYGHVQGDVALIHVARVLQDIGYQNNCFIARYGGDEFVMVGEFPNEVAAQGLCDQIDMALKAEAECLPFPISVSIGYACFTPRYSYIPDFIAKADRALYAAKARRQ